jgi:hypothetical protein
MGNWVIICHGRQDQDRGTVIVPAGIELQFWVNEGQPALVGAALTIVQELQRNPTDITTLQKMIDRTQWGSGVRWDATSGTSGQGVQSLYLWGDPTIGCVGTLNLDTGQFQRWTSVAEDTRERVLRAHPGFVHLICCR